MSAPRTAFEVVKSHLRLPINRDYEALKQVLRDWHAYTSDAPLQTKPTFPAELQITITRTPAGAAKARRTSADTSQIHERRGDPTALAPRSRRWGLWKRDASAAAASSVGDVHSSVAQEDEQKQEELPPVVYCKIVPMQVWTAVLPWEMQRGLSCSALKLPPSIQDKTHTKVEASVAAPVKEAKQLQEEEEEEDPFGIVTGARTAHHPSTPSSASAAASALASSSSSLSTPTSVTAAVPAMLFLADVPTTANYGIGFWSGAITQSLDVLFVAPTLPASVGPAAASFRHLRTEDNEAAVEDNAVSREVLRRYFPLQEMGLAAAPSTDNAVTFRVHSFAHLDPLPSNMHPSRVSASTAEARKGAAFTAAPDAPYNSLSESPRYIFEVPRHTLQPAVAAALRESARLLPPSRLSSLSAAFSRHLSGLAKEQAWMKQEVTESGLDGEVSIDLVVSMSDALREDVFGKAQLCVEYVALLEEAIAHYARELGRDATASAMASDPLDLHTGSAAAGPSSEMGGGNSGDDTPRKVWISEHEFRWMTPEELRNAASSPPPSAADEQGRMEDVLAEEVVEAEEEEKESAASSLAHATTPASPTLAAAAAAAMQATPAQAGAVRRDHSISLQSPMLRDEDDSRPNYLAPSFVGRHESSTFASSAVVLSADKLARYPETRPDMPRLPPIDYELYALCLRLGVGHATVLYLYHERVLQEWRRELQLRRLHKNVSSSSVRKEGGEDGVRRVSPAEEQCMLSLVRDRSLQLPSELVTLVEAVTAS